MRGDIPQAALNLLVRLPVRTHIPPEKPRKEYVKTPHFSKHRGKKIRHNGKLYKSQAELMAALKIGRRRLEALFDAGTAVYE